MFLFNKQIHILFLFSFFSNYAIFYFNISSGTISLRTTFIFWRWLCWPFCTKTKHLLTSLCNYILFSFITVLSGFQQTSFINIQRSLATYAWIIVKILSQRSRRWRSRWKFHTNFSWCTSVIPSRKLIKNRIHLLNWGFTMRQKLICFTGEYLPCCKIAIIFVISASEAFVPASAPSTFVSIRFPNGLTRTYLN